MARFRIVRVATSPPTFGQHFWNTQLFLQDKYLAEIRVMETDSGRLNLDALVLRRRDLRALRKCRLHACDVNLDAATIKLVGNLDTLAQCIQAELFVASITQVGEQVCSSYRRTREPMTNVPGGAAG